MVIANLNRRKQRILIVLFVLGACIILKYAIVIIAFGALLVYIGFFVKSRVFGIGGNGYAMENVYKIQYKIKNNLIDNLSAEEASSIMDIKGAWFIDETIFVNETKMSKEENELIKGFMIAIIIKYITQGIGLTLLLIGSILLLIENGGF